MTIKNTKVSFFDRPNVEKGVINVGEGIPFGMESVSNRQLGSAAFTVPGAKALTTRLCPRSSSSDSDIGFPRKRS